jgi:uncharacterized protein (UPF0248 family)
MVMREQDKHFLWSLYLAVAIIFLWRGLWEGLGGLPIIGSPWVALFIGLAMLTFRGLIYQQFDPLGGVEKSASQIINQIHQHPKRHEFHLKYHDHFKKEHVTLKFENVEKIENGVIVIKDPLTKKEIFIPVHRVTEILHKGKSYWKL